MTSNKSIQRAIKILGGGAATRGTAPESSTRMRPENSKNRQKLRRLTVITCLDPGDKSGTPACYKLRQIFALNCSRLTRLVP